MDNYESPPNSESWPAPMFPFIVTWVGVEMLFQEVIGLDAELPGIGYQTSKNPSLIPLEMPGLQRYGNVTMRKGVVKLGDVNARSWFNDIKMNIVKRGSVTISLVDETGVTINIGTLLGAWPVKIIDQPLHGNEQAIESMDVAHEGVIVGIAL